MIRLPRNHFEHEPPMEWRERISNVPPDKQPALDHNIALAVEAFISGGHRVVPHRVELFGDEWRAQRLELWEGPNQIRRQFLLHARSSPVPAVDGDILTGAVLPNGDLYGVPRPAPALKPASPPQLPPELVATAIAKAKDAIARGANRLKVLERLMARGIHTNDI